MLLRCTVQGRNAIYIVGFILISLCIIQATRLKRFGSSSTSRGSTHSIDNPSTASWSKGLAYRLGRSEEIYREMLRRREDLLGVYNSRKELPVFAATDAKSYKTTPFSVFDLASASFNCPWEMQRVGRMGDGGKWVCGMDKYIELGDRGPGCVIYSFGVRDESSFEEEVLQRTGCKVWGWDPAVDGFGPQLSPKFITEGRAKFTRAALGSLTKEPKEYTLKRLMEMNGHRFIDILKIDIEFAEFTSLTSFLDDFKNHELPCGQLLIELHLFKNRISAGEFLDWWEALESRGLRPVWTEPNLLYVTQKLADSMPRLAEYTLINTNSSWSILLQE